MCVTNTVRWVCKDLRRFGWTCGVHKAPSGYEHPWLAVTQDGTIGAWTREEARKLCKERHFIF